MKDGGGGGGGGGGGSRPYLLYLEVRSFAHRAAIVIIRQNTI